MANAKKGEWNQMKNKNNVAEQARQAGISSSVVYSRLNQGWKLDKALSTPVQKRKPRKVNTIVGRPVTNTKKRVMEVPVSLRVECYSDDPSKTFYLVLFGLSAIAIMLGILIITK